MKLLEANGKEELNAELSSIDISVPPRGEGRQTDDCERYCIVRFLAGLNKSDELDFPIKVYKTERPDFKVQFGDKYCWGVEITEAILTPYAHVLAVAESEKLGASIDISRFKNEEKMSPEEIGEIIHATELTGDGWAGENVEVKLTNKIKKIVCKKTKKFRSDGFLKFQDNFLIIYNNMPLPSFDLETVKKIISKDLDPYWESDGTFDGLFVDFEDVILLFEKAGNKTYAIPELQKVG